jgi:pimeloyl-ACP methyl ester carboxylesterase
MDDGFPSVDSSIRLRDGRRLAYAEYGEPAGWPIMLCHGTPGCRALYAPSIRAGTAGSRIIVADRPGYGGSDFYTGWGLLEWAGDLEQLAGALGIAQFAVVGLSGGGPYAAACAYRLPQRVRVAGLVSSPAPLPGDREGADQLPPAERALDEETAAARSLPWLEFLAWFREHYGSLPPDADMMLEQLAGGVPECDRMVFGQPETQETFRRSFPEMFRQGLGGWAWDSWLLDRPWPFRVQDIAVPAHIWQGELDPNVPIERGRYLATAIPNCRATFYAGTGHLLPSECWIDIFTALAS